MAPSLKSFAVARRSKAVIDLIYLGVGVVSLLVFALYAYGLKRI
jgi:hypothetical protein